MPAPPHEFDASELHDELAWNIGLTIGFLNEKSRQARSAGAATFDFSHVGSYATHGPPLCAQYLSALRDDGVSLDIRDSSDSGVVARLRDIGLFGALRGDPPPAKDPINATRLWTIRTVRDSESFANTARPLAADEEMGHVIRYCADELARNVAQHADSPAGGFAYAEHLPERREVHIAICDAGRGTLASLQAYYPEIVTDLESLRLAILPRTSGARPPGPYGSGENQGMGLFIVREIARRTGGELWLASGTGLLGICSTQENGPVRRYHSIAPLRGTLALLRLPDYAVVDFDELFATCHAIARDAIRDPTSVGLDFLDGPAELPHDATVLHIYEVHTDLGAVHRLRDMQLRPALEQGRQIVLDFAGVRFLSTSVAEALLGQAFAKPGSLTKLTFVNCTKATQVTIRTTAAIANARYRFRPEK